MDREIDHLNQHFLLSDLVNDLIFQAKQRRSAAFVPTQQGCIMKALDTSQSLRP